MVSIGESLEIAAMTGGEMSLDVAAGDFDTFYRSHYAMILRTAIGLTGELRAAEDLTQDAFIAARRNWGRVAGYDRPDLWVRRVVVNMSASRLRRLGRETKALLRLRGRELPPAESATPDPELWAAIRALPTRQAQVIVLSVVEDLPAAEVAGILGCGSETVRTHLRRAKARLAELLEEEES